MKWIIKWKHFIEYTNDMDNIPENIFRVEKIKYFSFCYIILSKNIRVNSIQFFIRTKLQQIAVNQILTVNTLWVFVLVNDTTLASDNPLRFRCNLTEKI